MFEALRPRNCQWCCIFLNKLQLQNLPGKPVFWPAWTQINLHFAFSFMAKISPFSSPPFFKKGGNSPCISFIPCPYGSFNLCLGFSHLQMGRRWVGDGSVWVKRCGFFNGIFRLQDGAPGPYYEVDLSLYPLRTMVYHRVCWGYNYLITRGPAPSCDKWKEGKGDKSRYLFFKDIVWSCYVMWFVMKQALWNISKE